MILWGLNLVQKRLINYVQILDIEISTKIFEACDRINIKADTKCNKIWIENINK